jgi:hypothetical protein
MTTNIPTSKCLKAWEGEGVATGDCRGAKQGGHVISIYQGHLMDVNSPYYLEREKRWKKDIWNTPFMRTIPNPSPVTSSSSFRRKSSQLCVRHALSA